MSMFIINSMKSTKKEKKRRSKIEREREREGGGGRECSYASDCLVQFVIAWPVQLPLLQLIPFSTF